MASDQVGPTYTDKKLNEVMFNESGPLTDIALVVEGRKLHVNKAVLAVASEVFERMFERDFKEKTATEIPLPGKKYSNMIEFLLCLYPSSMKVISLQSVHIVLHLADEYQVLSLKEKCELFILHCCEHVESVATDRIVFFLFLADRYNLPAARERCLEIGAVRPFRETKQVGLYSEISGDTKYELLEKRMLLVEEPAVIASKASKICKKIDHDIVSTLVKDVEYKCKCYNEINSYDEEDFVECKLCRKGKAKIKNTMEQVGLLCRTFEYTNIST